MVTNLDAKFNLNDDLDKIKGEIYSLKNFVQINQKEEFKVINPNIITDAIFEYFSDNINNTALIEKTGSFTQEEKEKIKNIFNDYLSKHRFLVIGKDRKVKIEIDDKRALISTIKKIGKIIGKKISSKKNPGIKGKVANIGIDIAGNRLIGNIEKELKEMNRKEYMDIIYGYIGGVIKIVLKHTNGTMTKGDLLTNFLDYFPNQNKEIIINVIKKTGIWNENLTLREYIGYGYYRK